MQLDTTNTQVRTWRDWLARFQAEATTKGFADYMTSFVKHGPLIPAFQYAPLYGYVLNAKLIDAYLMAAVQAAPNEAEAALAEIHRATQDLRYDQRPPKSLSRDAKETYAPIVKIVSAEVKLIGALLFDVFMRYVRGETDEAGDADAVFREACALSLAGDDVAAIQRMGTAGALVLRGSPMWRGWQDEGSDVFSRHAMLLHSAFESCQKVLPLLPIAEQRLHANEFVQKLRWAPEEKPSDMQLETVNQAEPSMDEVQRVTRLMVVAEADAPWTDEEIQTSAAERDELIQIAKDILYSMAPVPKEMDVEVKSIAMRALGILPRLSSK